MGDKLGDCNVTPAGYAHMTYMLGGLANGRMAVALEVSQTSLLSLLKPDILSSSGRL
jgi:acetoin utilization deacetylase AcuC-like enzyme